MLHVERRFSRAIAPLLLAIALSGCAAGPGSADAPPAPQAAQSTGDVAFNTGRLTVYVSDQNGRRLDRTNVDVTGAGGYRATGVTDRDGRVQFNGVPPTVQVSAVNQGGSYAQSFNVPPNGSSEMRMIIDIFENEQVSTDLEADPGAGF